MSFFPADDMKSKISLNLAPMMDFLFLMLVFFACLAVSRINTRDTEIDLVALKTSQNSATSPQDHKIIEISVSSEGHYKWVTEMRDYAMNNAEDVSKELLFQYEKGILPEDKHATHILLKIDSQAKWKPILEIIFAIRNAGFEAYPVYIPER